MPTFASELARATRDRLIAVGGRIYCVTRVNSDKLRHVGWAALEGAASVRQAMKAIDVERDELRKRIAAMPAELRAAEEEKLRAQAEHLNRSQWEALVGRPEGEEAMAERLNAYICAAVVGGGLMVQPLGPDEPLRLVPDDIEPDAIGQKLDNGKYLEPLRFVQDRKDEDIAGGKVWIYRLSETERNVLGMAIIQLQSVAGEVLPFREGAGSAPGDRPDREAVREVAARGAAAEPVRDGAGGGLHRAGGRKQRAARGEGDAGGARRRVR